MQENWFKRNWFWLLIIPVAAFFVYRYISAKVELSQKMRAVRAARDNHQTEEIEESKPEVENDNSN